jgi:ABC-type nitrate/sulfonate/bicarbonate transport system substrate-binding protein
MAGPEKVSELVARLRKIGDDIVSDVDEKARVKLTELLQDIAVQLEQESTGKNSRGDAYVLVLIDAHSHPVSRQTVRG